MSTRPHAVGTRGGRRDLLDAVVVGGGVVGLALALGLARAGRGVALVEERLPAPWRADAPDLRVYAIAPDSAAWLDTLGAWGPIVDARAPAYRRMQVWDAGGGAPLVFDADALARTELGWIVEHGLLVDRLWAAALQAGVRVESPASVTGLVQDVDQVAVQLDAGPALRARRVVAADGAQSRLRGWAGIDAPAHEYAQAGLVAYVECADGLQATCWQRFLPTGPLAVLPCEGAHRASIVWTLPTADAERLRDAEVAVFDAALTTAFAARLGAMRVASARVAFPLRRQLASTLHAGRVLVVGDAAHVVHPLAGQGVNLGLRDAAALVEVFAASRGEPSDARLARWARTRRSENALAAGVFDGLNRLFSNDAMVPLLMRGAALGIAGRIRPLTRALWRRAAGV